MFIGSTSFEKVDAPPGSDYWYTGVGVKTSSGAHVSPELSLALSAVYACVKVLAESVAQLPLYLYQIDGERKSLARSHVLFNILNRRPNHYQTPFEWREMMMGHAVLRGGGYSEVVYDLRGKIECLLPLHPDKVTPRIVDGVILYDINMGDQGARTLNQSNMFHVRGLSSDGLNGLNPIQVQRQVIGTSIAAQDFSARFYANDAKPGGWLEYPGNFSSKEQRDAFTGSWTESQSAGNRGKTAVLEKGMKYHELSLSNEDAQFIETRKFQVEEIARMFRVPPHKIGHLDRSTDNNIEHQGLEFVTDTLMPWLVRFEQAIMRDLIVDDEADKYFAEFEVDSLFRGDIKTRYESYALGIQNSILSPNEARAKENLNAIPGLDVPLQPLNMAPAAALAAITPGGFEAEIGVTESIIPTVKESTEDPRFSLLQQRAAKIVAKREASKVKYVEVSLLAEFYKGYADYVSDVMAVSISVANKYCDSRCEEGLNAIESGYGSVGLRLFFDECHIVERIIKSCSEY